MTEPVDPVSTVPPTQPSFAPIADLFSARVRSLIYLLSILVAPAYLVVEANVTMPWPVLAAYASWNALVGLVAVSNVPRAASE